ncbi:helix-turn-helix domain-containing protein [Pasteurella multocida]|uniref:helix-turn-helix domain-containing protein n=2 Tax=Pasteurella multocida TaxID=747 RepID=UPI00099B34F2|nr:helix-turn-helix domain-containing protein [Pasteurella multocida]MCL7804889.1 helix-turn-helix domain-containing protein [Pasteurella multocida]MCL7828081.1 helix-turn-helix domain-containing protein [Pasteurella multocida]OPC85490.1 hypothetical protein BTV54_11420 [Pasteurella multocida subsp. multocida]OPC90731.1 hypothetical protein BTV58_11700 [Pasteurella multocida subsp. multocida]
MSMRLMAQAMSIKVGNPLRKLVLIKLADNANDDGVCFPSYQYIADVCEISKASARNHIDALIEMGLVSKKARKNKDGSSSNLYFLHLDKGMPADSTGMPADSTGMPADSTGGMLRDSTITSHSLEPVNESNTPLPPKGESANADGVPVVENKKQRSLNIDYVGIGKAYNECVMESGKNLPMLADPENLSQERKRKIKKLADVMKKRFGSCDAETFRNYFLDFMRSARQFYFGENDRGWRADFEYILREKVMDKTIEGSL